MQARAATLIEEDHLTLASAARYWSQTSSKKDLPTPLSSRVGRVQWWKKKRWVKAFGMGQCFGFSSVLLHCWLD